MGKAFVVGAVLMAAQAFPVPSYYRPVHDVWCGYGPDSANTGSTHHPMAYAYFTSAFISDTMLSDAKRMADWLVKNKDIDEDGFVGWGTSYATDSFGDGSINPAHTEYGVTTGVVANALLDAYEAFTDSAYLETAIEALEAYSIMLKPDGHYPYSVRGDDHYTIHAVTGELMGASARAARLGGHDGLQRVADKNLAALMAVAMDSGSTIKWPYGEAPYDSENDFTHSVAIVKGLMEYKADEAIVAKALSHLHIFLRDGVIYRYSTGTSRARAHGLGVALVVAKRAQDQILTDAILSNLEDYKAGDIYGILPGETTYFPRVQSRVAWGLATQ